MPKPDPDPITARRVLLGTLAFGAALVLLRALHWLPGGWFWH